MSEQPDPEPDVVDPGRFELTEPEYELFENGRKSDWYKRVDWEADGNG